METIKTETPVLNMTRILRASPEQVFDAWSSLEAMTQWFGPGTCQVVEGDVDFTVGGRYRLNLLVSDCEHSAVGGTYRVIDRPNRLEFSWAWEGGEAEHGTEMVVAIELAPVDGGTELTLTQTGFASQESCDKHRQGWGGSFDKLETR